MSTSRMFGGPRPPPRRVWVVLLMLSLVGFCWYYNLATKLALLPNGPGSGLTGRKTGIIIIRFGNNSLRFPDKPLRPHQLIVDDGKCQIEAISPWTTTTKMKPHVKVKVNKMFPKTAECNQARRISVIKDQEIILDLELLAKLSKAEKGQNVSCCYKSIYRKLPPLENYTRKVDDNFYYSKNCTPMGSVTIPRSIFIKVKCMVKVNSSSSSKVVYRKFHAIPLLPPHHQQPTQREDAVNVAYRIEQIVDFWEQCRKNNLASGSQDEKLCNSFKKGGRDRHPPNVLLLGIDSTSRLNFRRYMKKTVKVLERIEAVEMKGYTKVGLNTFPNFIPLSTSLSVGDLRTTCVGNRSDSFDDCPVIWKEFKALKYLTGLVEDHPSINAFNYRRTGFVVPPVDLYLRPFMLALYKKGLAPPLHCDEYESVEEMMINFAVDALSAGSSKHVPVFITSWMTDMTHTYSTGLQGLDSQALLHLWINRVLDNTIIFVVGDHGYRETPFRATLSGYYEDKLPVLWIHIPEMVRKTHPEWWSVLTNNSRSLATPYDVHATLHHILSSVNASSDSEYKDPTVIEWGIKARGRSLLRPLPLRNCAEASIPMQFCPCSPLQYDDLDMIGIAAEAVLARYNNDKKRKHCQPLSVSSVFSSGLVLGQSDVEYTERKSKLLMETPRDGDYLVLGLVVNPGGKKVEVLVAFNEESSTFNNFTYILEIDYISCRRIKRNNSSNTAAITTKPTDSNFSQPITNMSKKF